MTSMQPISFRNISHSDLTMYGIAINITVKHYIYIYITYIINPVALSFHLTNNIVIPSHKQVTGAPDFAQVTCQPWVPDMWQQCHCSLLPFLSPAELNSVKPQPPERNCRSWREKYLLPDRTLISGKVGRTSPITLVCVPC